MAYIVNSTISQTATVFNSDESAFHGLKRDEDGLLTYTKIPFRSNETVNLSDFAIAYDGLDDLNTGRANEAQRGTQEENRDQYESNGGARAYDGARFDSNKVTYFMNDNGFLVARYFSDFSYNVGQNGQTRNWIV